MHLPRIGLAPFSRRGKSLFAERVLPKGEEAVLDENSEDPSSSFLR